ncbi:MAG: DNA replication and repair protein RecF [Oscillospiraceae bacterium]|nr:DNA replication and repair protein RecF [Oscillospiraceae bacterium]
MTITHFTAQAFRNITRGELSPCSGVNVIFGENGQGKTNLLEGMWLFTGCRSFRCTDNRELIQHAPCPPLIEGGCPAGQGGGVQRTTSLAATFTSNAREQTASIDITRRRALTLNGFAQETPRRMLGVFPAVAFTPATLALAQGSPAERRRFLDVALSMLTPAYAVRLSKYLKALAQRNALLRHPKPDLDLLVTWDETLAHHAAQLTAARARYLQQLIPAAQEFYAGISAGREVLGIEIHCTGHDFTRSRQSDLRRQMTTVGPHRDDFILTLSRAQRSDGAAPQVLRDFGSQGQQRSAALALKLAEAAVLRDTTGETPVALLDDVLSELDARRQRDLLRYLDGWQVFLTCCEPSHTLHGSAGRVFCVTNGDITPQ